MPHQLGRRSGSHTYMYISGSIQTSEPEREVVNGGILRQCSGVHKYEENDRLHMGIKKLIKLVKNQKEMEKTYIGERASNSFVGLIIEDAASRFPFASSSEKRLFLCIIAQRLRTNISLFSFHSSSSSSPFQIARPHRAFSYAKVIKRLVYMCIYRSGSS